METRALLAIILSIAVLAGFQYFFGNQMAPVDLNATNTTNKIDEVKNAPLQKKDVDKKGQNKSLTSLSDLHFPKEGLNATKGKDIIVETPLFKAVLTENGGNFKHFVLKKYKESLDKDSKGVDLINVSPPLLPFGIKVFGGKELDLRARFFSSNKDRITLTNPDSKDEIIFTCDLAEGVKLIKKYSFKGDKYIIDFQVQLIGASANKYSIFLYDRPYKASTTYIFSGPSYFTPDKGLEEISLDKPGEMHTYSGPLDWLSYGDNYFMIALIPQETKGPWSLVITKLDDLGLTESKLSGLVSTKEVGSQIKLCNMMLYLGPKEIERLKSIGHNLSKAINFGWFDPIAKPLLYILNFFYKYFHNYGVAIIVLTILIKLLFWPLAHKSAQSMKTMQKLQPKLQKLKEKYGDDKERLNKELMQLYRTYKVNPMSGCLPMLLQIPVFFALYKVLLQAIELRHAPFVLWINDLSAPDRLMIPGVEIPMLGGIPVLTILMGISMYVQQKMSPSSLDPTQAKMMQFLPIIFTFMFINFPSGLVLYWLVNNILSIIQQYYVNKFTD